MGSIAASAIAWVKRIGENLKIGKQATSQRECVLPVAN